MPSYDIIKEMIHEKDVKVIYNVAMFLVSLSHTRTPSDTGTDRDTEIQIKNQPPQKLRNNQRYREKDKTTHPET